MSVGSSRRLKELLRVLSLGVDSDWQRGGRYCEVEAHRPIYLRGARESRPLQIGEIIVPADGGDPVVGSHVLVLQRRERRILICLARAQGRWVSRRQIFICVFGMMSDVQDERIIDVYMSRLRRRLRLRLGVDPIEARDAHAFRLSQ